MAASQDLEVSAPSLRWPSERMALKWENATSSERVRQVAGVVTSLSIITGRMPFRLFWRYDPTPTTEVRHEPPENVLVFTFSSTSRCTCPVATKSRRTVLRECHPPLRKSDRSRPAGLGRTQGRSACPPGTERGREVDHDLRTTRPCQTTGRPRRGSRLRPTSGRVCRPSGCHAPVRLGNRLAPRRPRRRGPPSRPAALQQTGTV